MRIVLVVVLGFWCANASALLTAGELAEMCGITKNASTTELAGCLGYISGAVDQAAIERALRVAVNRKMYKKSPEEWSVDELTELDKKRMRLYCRPDGTTAQQMVAVIGKFLRDNPARWHEPAAPLVIEALKAAFPCK